MHGRVFAGWVIVVGVASYGFILVLGGCIGVFSLLVVGCMIWYSCKEALLRFLDSDDSDSSQS